MKHEVQTTIKFDNIKQLTPNDILKNFKEIDLNQSNSALAPVVSLSTGGSYPVIWFNKRAENLVSSKWVKALYDAYNELLLIVPCSEEDPNAMVFGRQKKKNGLVWSKKAIVDCFCYSSEVLKSGKRGMFRFACEYRPEVKGLLVDLKKCTWERNQPTNKPKRDGE